jgi:hypothetical protein
MLSARDLAAFTPRSTRGTYVVAREAHGEVRYFKLRLSTFKHSVDVPKAQLAVPGKRCGAAELQQVVELTPLFSWPASDPAPTPTAHRAGPCPLSDRACQHFSLLTGAMLIH